MITWLVVLAVVRAMFDAGPRVDAQAPTTGSRHSARRFEARTTRSISASYLLYLPADHTKKGDHGPCWYTCMEAAFVAMMWSDGVMDKEAPVAEADALVEAVRAAGGNVQYTRLDDGDHFLLDRYYGRDWQDWLLEHRR